MPLDRDTNQPPSGACLAPERAARFAAGALSPDEAVVVEQHLDACSACRRYVSALVKAGGPSSSPGAPAPDVPVPPAAAPVDDATAPPAAAPADGPPIPHEAPRVDGRDRNHLIGTILKGTYRVLRVIGSGGMGVVYEAEHTRLPRRFAIKVLRESDALDQQARERFRREALIASELGHRHIAPVHDFDTTPEGLSYLVMDLLEGEDLATRLGRGPLEAGTALRVVSEIASALDLAHCRGIVHRDLKPANVFLCREPDGAEVVKLLDFGMSKLADSTSQLTRSLSYLGTPHYMAPEQARGDSGTVDPRSDVFALGVMTFEMFLGRRPFAGPSLEAILYQVVHEPLPSASAIDHRLPVGVDPVLERATAKDRQARYPSTGAFAADLAAALGAHGGPRAAAADRPSGLTRRWLGPVLLASLALGALTAALTLALSRASPPRPAPGPPPTVMIEIRIEATPAHAVATWDGRPLAGGLLRLPADGREHRVVVKAPGFQSVERTVTADRSQTLVLALAAAAAASPAVAPAAPSRSPPVRPKARPATGPAPPVPAPPIIEDPNEL